MVVYCKLTIYYYTILYYIVLYLGGQQEYLHMLPLVCNDAVALLFMFDLSRKSTLTSIKSWYKQARLLNKTAIPFLIGTKYDYYINMKSDEKYEITTQVRKFARAMKAPLLFCSASHSINVHKIFKVVLSKVFDLKCNVEQITGVGEPLIEYEINENIQSTQSQNENNNEQTNTNDSKEEHELNEKTKSLSVNS